MLINLTDFFKNDHKTECMVASFEADSIEVDMVECPITYKSDVNLLVESLGDGKVSVKGKFEMIFNKPCDRCLKDVAVKINPDFEVTLVEPDGFHEYDPEDQLFLDGYELDIEALVSDEVIMSLPMKVLCKEDCKGLCLKCGNNLNEVDCGCDRFVPDPRLAAIQDIFNAYNKEV